MKLSDMLVSLCKRLRLSKRLHLCKRFHLCKRLRLSKRFFFAKGCASPKCCPLQMVRRCKRFTLCTPVSVPAQHILHGIYIQSYRPVRSPSDESTQHVYVAWQNHSGIGRPIFLMFPDSPSVIYRMAGGIYLVPGCNNPIHQVCAANLIKENIYLLNISHDVSFLRWEGRVVDIIPSLEDFILKGQWRKLWKFHTFQDRKTTISSSSDRGKKVLSWICR